MRMAVFAAPLVLSACASVQDRVAEAPSLSSYTLCEKLSVAVLADPRVREAWAQELSRRGDNCGQYAPTIQATQATDAQAMELARRLQQSRQAAAPLPAMPNAQIAVLKSSYPSGANRICVYTRGGSDYVTTQTVTLPCPPTQ